MEKPAHFFDIESPNQLFGLLKATAHSFSRSRGKSTKDLLFLVFGLTHLREWIAPDYRPPRTTRSPEERFFQSIYELKEFQILQALCNRSKHMSAGVEAMGSLYEGTFDDIPDIDACTNVDHGAPTAHFVDGHDVEDLIRVVLQFYENNWFKTANEGSTAA